jgi:hypothetical protein
MSPTTLAAQTTPHIWTITTIEGITLTGYQPDWSLDNPSRTHIALGRAMNYLRGCAHYTMLPVDPVLPPATLDIDIDGTRYRESTNLMFASQIACHPYAENPHRRSPTASLTIVEEWDFEGLTPTDLARFATQIRTQADYFKNTVLPALVAARENWAADRQTKPALPWPAPGRPPSWSSPAPRCAPGPLRQRPRTHARIRRRAARAFRAGRAARGGRRVRQLRSARACRAERTGNGGEHQGQRSRPRGFSGVGGSAGARRRAPS